MIFLKRHTTQKKITQHAYKDKYHKGKSMPLISCPFCNFSKEVLLEDIPRGTFSAKCPQCAQIFKTGPFRTAPDIENNNGEIEENPWEQRNTLGFFDGFIKTVGAVLFKPARFFKNITSPSGVGESFCFGIIVGISGNIITILWGFIITMLYLNMGVPFFTDISDITPIPFILLYPLFAICNILITAFIIHTLLFLVRANSGKFGGTLKVVSYSQATKLFSIIPVVGDIISLFWQMVITFIGLKIIHSTSYARLIIAFIIPFIVIIAIILAFIFFIITQFGREIFLNELNLDFLI